MKLLYITLGAFLVWYSPVMAEDSTDFGLDDKIITEEAASDPTSQNSEEVTDVTITETISEEVPDFTEEEITITETEENSVAPDETTSVEEEVVTPAEAEETTSAEDEQDTEEIPSQDTNETPTSSSEENATSETPTQSESEAAAEEENIAQPEPEEDTRTKEEFEEEISYYIKNMNLSVEQLDMAKYISNDSRLKIEQLLKSIYLLRSQARELENKSLNDFEAILTEEQREQFHKLRDTMEKEREKFEVLHIQPNEEPVGEGLSDAVSDSESGQESS